MTRIVTTHYRYKRPRGKRKPIALEGLAIVQKAKPGNDNHPDPASRDETGHRSTTKLAIVTTTSQKRVGKRAAEPDNDPEATARVKAFFARMIRPGGALPPEKP